MRVTEVALVPVLVVMTSFIKYLVGSNLGFFIFSLWVHQHAGYVDRFANSTKRGVNYVLLVFHLAYFFHIPPKISNFGANSL